MKTPEQTPEQTPELTPEQKLILDHFGTMTKRPSGTLAHIDSMRAARNVLRSKFKATGLEFSFKLSSMG